MSNDMPTAKQIAVPSESDIEALIGQLASSAYQHGYHMSLAGDRWYECDVTRAKAKLRDAIRKLHI